MELVSTSEWDSGIYVQELLNTTTVVVLQVLCHYEFMIEMSSLMSENQVKKSFSYVASPHVMWMREGALQGPTKLDDKTLHSKALLPICSIIIWRK